MVFRTLLAPSSARLILAGILGIGAFVRLYRLDLTWYFLDQVRDVSTATAILSGERFPLLGPLIGWTQGRLGPLYYYLIAPSFLVSDTPLAGAVFMALAGVVAILLTYRLAADYFGTGVALVAASLFAVFPLAVLSSRVLWNPGLIPLFTLLLMRALFDVIVNGHSRSVIGIFACLAVLTQLHLTTVPLAVVALLAMLVWRPRLRVAHVLAGLGVFTALYAPYLAYELRHGFENTRALFVSATGHAGTEGERAIGAVLNNLLVLDRSVLDAFVVHQPWPPFLGRAFSVLYSVEAILFAGGMLICLYRCVRGERYSAGGLPRSRRSVGLLLLWLLAPVIMLGARKTALWWYYFDVIYPSQFIVVGIAVSTLTAPALAGAAGRRILLGATVGTIIAIVAAQTWFQIGFQRRIDMQAEIVLDIPRLSVASAHSPLGTVSFLPYRYRERLLTTLLADFGLEPNAFPAHVHGPVLGLPEESMHLLRYLARGVRAHGHTGMPSLHYVVIKDTEAAAPASTSRSARVGPYLIAAYEPAIDYRDWQCAPLGLTAAGQVTEGSWQRRELPAVDVAAPLLDDGVLACRGRVRVPSRDRPTTVTVSLITETPIEVFQLEGGHLARLARQSWHSPSLYTTTEAVFGTTGAVAMAGHEPIAFAVGGARRVMRIDIYERGG